ncbi:MAG: hypothetical protein Q4E67_07265, partial [Planctomycetia bacterium]|nr:hypothetical protein [Planctomycetia bacterium]
MRLPYDIALFLGWRGVREMSVFPCPILLDYTKDYSTIKTCELYRFPILAILYFVYKCYSRLRRYTLQGIRTLGLRKKDCQKNPPKPACLRKFPYPKSHP